MPIGGFGGSGRGPPPCWGAGTGEPLASFPLMREFGSAFKAGELEVPKPTTLVGTSGVMDRDRTGVRELALRSLLQHAVAVQAMNLSLAGARLGRRRSMPMDAAAVIESVD